jgi:hypothetical protein
MLRASNATALIPASRTTRIKKARKGKATTGKAMKLRRKHKARRKAAAYRKPNKTSTAYHEAGHAVIGRVLTLPCGHATIKPDYSTATAGVSICLRPSACMSEWERRGKVRDSHSAWTARIMHSMAGAEAEIELLGTPGKGDEDDRHQIALMMEEAHAPADGDWDKYEARLRAMTRMLVRRHKVRIKRVAKALLARTTLTAKQLDKLVG